MDLYYNELGRQVELIYGQTSSVEELAAHVLQAVVNDKSHVLICDYGFSMNE